MIELAVATAIMLLVVSGVFAALNPATGAFAAEPEAADAQQRLRVAADTIAREIRSAGVGAQQGRLAGPLIDVLAPVQPLRRGRRSPDPPGTFRSDTVSVLRVVTGAAQTTLTAGFVAQSGAVLIDTAGPGCPSASLSCGFRAGMDVVIFDGSGAYDLFTITSVSGNLLDLRHNMAGGWTYAPGSRIAEAQLTTLYLKQDPATSTYQLMHYNGAAGSDVPVVDHVVDLSFDWYGIADSPRLLRPVNDPAGPWTTYGPAPPDVVVRSTAYPAGENCLFTLDASGTAVSRVPALGGPAGVLTPLLPAMLGDGPWCPDATSPNRYDADLLRVRQLMVTIRVQAAAASARSAATALFSKPGTSATATHLVPDREVRLAVRIGGPGAGR